MHVSQHLNIEKFSAWIQNVLKIILRQRTKPLTFSAYTIYKTSKDTKKIYRSLAL